MPRALSSVMAPRGARYDMQDMTAQGGDSPDMTSSMPDLIDEFITGLRRDGVEGSRPWGK